MSIAEKLTTIAENMQKVYDAGKASAYRNAYDEGYEEGFADGHSEGYDVGSHNGYGEGYSQAESDFWDGFQDYGKRNFYEYGFARTAFEPLHPKHKAVPTSRTICMFEYLENTKVIEKAYFDLSQASVTSQSGSSTGGHYATFRGNEHSSLEVIEDIGLQPGGYYQTFRYLQKLRTLEVLRVLENTKFDSTFHSCISLENLTIEGTIGQNNFNVSWSTKLSHDSLMSIITALKDYSTDTSGTQWVVTLGTANLNKLTDAEKAIATQKGWTLA